MDNGIHSNFDLPLLKPAADTLRTFEYTLLSADERIVNTISAILPHLTNSASNGGNFAGRAYSSSLENDYLTILELSSDSEVNAWDTIYAGSPFISPVFPSQRVTSKTTLLVLYSKLE